MPRTTSSSLHLPHEVLAAIVHFVDDKPTLATLLRVCRATYDLASRPLYAELVVTYHTLTAYRVGLLPPERRTAHDNIATYPNAESDRRKRALLALTTIIRVRSVPKLVDGGGEQRGCPLDKATFPSARTIHVSMPVPHHLALEARRRSRRREAMAA